MNDHIRHLLAEALRYTHFRIDQMTDWHLDQHDRAVESARRSIGQKFRWARFA
jgi:hypothetical protein